MSVVAELVGKTLREVQGASVGSETITFTVDDGMQYVMLHDQECCESVAVEDVCGDPADLVGSPITQAEESSSEERPAGLIGPDGDSCTWTFYRIATAKGLVVIRWLGESNGYYSEDVDFRQVRA